MQHVFGGYIQFVNMRCRVRQGGVLSPHLFSIYVDYVIDKITRIATLGAICVQCIRIIFLFMYADGLLQRPAVTYLQRLIHLVESEFIFFIYAY